MSTDLRYPGARPFQRGDSGRFFGRDAEAAELSTLWLRRRLTFISGPAGIGKTSLLTAGVLPLVNRSDVELLPIGGFSRGSSSPAAPPGQHTPYTLALLRAWSGQGTVPGLDPFTVDEFVARHAQRHDPSVVILAAIDQADDLFTGPRSRQPQRQRFMQELAAAMEHPALHLLISVRDETLFRFTEALGTGAHVRLEALKPDLARQAVEGPGCFDQRAARDLVMAIRTSHIVGPGGIERHVVADDVEPALLQAACARLWELLYARTRKITPRELRLRGDVNAVLSAYCGAAIAAVANAHDVPVPWLRSWLISTFVAPAGDRQDANEGQSRTAGLPTTVARALEDRHLLRARAGQSAASRIYRLISDRVIEPLRHAPDDIRPDDDPSGYLLAAERALTVGELRLAGRYAELARVAAPETDLVLHGSARSLLGNIAREEDEPDRAEEHYRAALDLFEAAMEYSMVALLLVAIGRTLIERGQLLAGINELHAAALRRPADTTVQTELSAAVQEFSWRLHRGDGPPNISPG